MLKFSGYFRNVLLYKKACYLKFFYLILNLAANKVQLTLIVATLKPPSLGPRAGLRYPQHYRFKNVFQIVKKCYVYILYLFYWMCEKNISKNDEVTDGFH